MKKGIVITLWAFGAASVAPVIFFSALYVSNTNKASANLTTSLMRGGCPPVGPSLAGSCKDLYNALDSRAVFGDMVWMSLIVGHALALAGTGIWYFNRSEPASQTSVRVLPTVSGRGGGVLADVTF